MKIDKENFINYIKKRDEKGLQFAVDLYGSLVYKVVYSVLGNNLQVNSIDECVNDVFLALWNNIESYQEEKGNFKGWLIAISKYKAIDYKRKMANENHLEYIDDFAEKACCDDSDIENLIISKENKKELLKLINELNDTDRNIFIRTYFLGEKREDIAKDLRVNRSVIDNRLSRGRKLLREKIIVLKEVL